MDAASADTDVATVVTDKDTTVAIMLSEMETDVAVMVHRRHRPMSARTRAIGPTECLVTRNVSAQGMQR
ncbi:hypothetical protein AAVH_15320 [Aphelenchoides avenae]|nr:hypothetical protein AAVH_15320 [Aphelenchus avenae]